ncbi:binding-protein-dependent transport system inner membrane component [Paenibacillus algicola]|uniref:Binding-protein-dependent transport system inner membrane component n=1 Tax=Paenibacillus algicola TaxID=2565926 RepID=A0A4P8XMA9_9BACL|nr:carbohydrate ABC transporter permease [Paenibacillus algicola]QCT03668.1 binding-protein-dependent transport system inner membrane component [Paenibacillus algicola]
MEPTTIKEKGGRSLKITAYVVTITFVIFALIPTLWMFASSLKTEKDINSYPPKWLPSIPQSIDVTIDYTGTTESDPEFYEKDAMRAMWYPWMKNIRESIGDVQVTGIKDGKVIYTAETVSSMFLVGQPKVVPTTIFNETMMDRKLPVIREQKLSEFQWKGEEGGAVKATAAIAETDLASRFSTFYQSNELVKGQVVSIQEDDSWISVFSSYLALNKVAQDTAGPLGFAQYFLNSTIITVSSVLVQLVLGGLAGYALAHLIESKRWKFFWVMFFLATIMIPDISLLLPLYLLMKDLGLVNSLLAVILPHTAWGIVIFLFKGFFEQISKELLQAARVDGATEWRTFIQIVTPLSIPIFTTVAVMTFIPVWNEFLWPLVVNSSPKYWTFTVALNDLQNQPSVLQNMLMASALVSMIPLLLIFLFAQKYIEKGVSFSGVKG